MLISDGGGDGRSYRASGTALLTALTNLGYRELRLPPWLDYEAAYPALNRLGIGTCKFIAPDGRVLVLLPDPTLAIAVGGLLPPVFTGEQRVSYWGDVYRVAPGEGWVRLAQVGAELIGPSSVDADVETVKTALQAVAAAGRNDVRVVLTTAGLVDGLCRLLPADLREQVQAALWRGDFVALERISAAEPRIGKALRYCGDADGLAAVLTELIAAAPAAAVAEDVDRLQQIAHRLRAAGCAHDIVVDVSLVREVGYYDGFVFQLVERGSGMPLAAGGRYDQLLRNVGVEAGGAGFGCHLDRLLQPVATPGDGVV